MKIIAKKLPGSALLISLLILTGIFIIAFGAGYLSFFNTKNTDSYQQSAKARLAAEAGVERMKWEVGKNNFDFSTSCGVRIFETQLDAGYYYYLTCTLDTNNHPMVRSVGVYKNVSVTIDSGFCYDINTDCNDFCAIGSLCGGGILFSVNPPLVASPSACSDSTGTDCDNSFAAPDTLILPWDNVVPPGTVGCSSDDDGRYNALKMRPAGNPNYEAAFFCHKLEVNGFSDWYLPAKNELNTLLRNSDYCENNTVGPDPNGCEHGSNSTPIVGGFAPSGANQNYYQSSSECTDCGNNVWWQLFDDGTQLNNAKEKIIFVRCIRRY